MKIVAYEGVDRQIVEELRRENHEVTYVAELRTCRKIVLAPSSRNP